MHGHILNVKMLILSKPTSSAVSPIFTFKKINSLSPALLHRLSILCTLGLNYVYSSNERTDITSVFKSVLLIYTTNIHLSGASLMTISILETSISHHYSSKYCFTRCPCWILRNRIVFYIIILPEWPVIISLNKKTRSYLSGLLPYLPEREGTQRGRWIDMKRKNEKWEGGDFLD